MCIFAGLCGVWFFILGSCAYLFFLGLACSPTHRLAPLVLSSASSKSPNSESKASNPGYSYWFGCRQNTIHGCPDSSSLSTKKYGTLYGKTHTESMDIHIGHTSRIYQILPEFVPSSFDTAIFLRTRNGDFRTLMYRACLASMLPSHTATCCALETNMSLEDLRSAHSKYINSVIQRDKLLVDAIFGMKVDVAKAALNSIVNKYKAKDVKACKGTL